MIDWAVEQMKEIEIDLLGAFLFGSAISDPNSARDVDVVFVVYGPAGGSSWEHVREKSSCIKKRFYERFSKELSIIVATEPEWKELDTYLTGERKALI